MKDLTAEKFDSIFAHVESAVTDIQLFGSPTQVAPTLDFARRFAGSRSASIGELLRELRHDLRRELRLEEVDQEILHLRLSRPRKAPNEEGS